MASFTAGTTFVDGVANDVTAAKLGALVTNATPTSGLIQDRTAETVVATNDTLLIGDASDSNTLKRMTVANVMKAELTGTINTTAGTIQTLTSSTATITTGTVATLNSTTGTITNLVSTTGTVATLNSTTGTITTGVIPTLTSITKITSGTGTAAAPAISPTGDTNTGIFFPAADTVAFAEGGAESMRIDSSGNVGIGTTTPSQLLEVGAESISNTYIQVSASNNTAAGIKFRSDSSLTTGYDIGYEGNGNHFFFKNDVGGTVTERMRIDSGGNVGIGTTAQVNKLEVVGSFGRGAPVAKTADFTLAATENWIIVNKPTTACTVTLPAASLWTGREFTIKTIQNLAVNSASSNIVALNADVISTSILSGTAGSWATLVSTGVYWYKMAGSA
jgi:hypothetical protein